MADKAATQQGAEKPDGEEDEIKTSPTPERNPRNAILNEIAVSHRDRRTEELSGDEDDDPDEEEEELPDNPDDDKDPDEPTPDEEEGGEDEMITLIIDGKEQRVPMTQVLDTGKRALQKNYAADARLAEATRLLKEAKTATQQEDDDEEEPSTGDLNLHELAEKIQYGTTEDVEEALKKLTSNRGGVNLEQVTAYVDEKRAYSEAFEQFKTDFPNIAGDKELMSMVSRRDSELLDGGDQRSYRERYTEIGKEINSWLESKGVQTTTREIQDRAKHKRASKHVSSGGNRGTGKPPPEPRSRSEIIADIAAARGQKL